MLRHLHTWFDAFRTLKLVHLLRDDGLPSLSCREALRLAPFDLGSAELDLEALRTRMARIDEAGPRWLGLGDADDEAAQFFSPTSSTLPG
jgi:hypothetical protein